MALSSAPVVQVIKDKIVRAAYAHQRDTIVPRNGKFLVLCIVARISGGPRQKELSLEDQVDHAKEATSELYGGPVEFRVIATKAKGEWRDRPELLLVEEQLRSREVDLLFLEDIGRLIRGADAVKFVGIAVDHGTRVLAPNDCIDTIDDDWEEDVIQACRDHVGHNSHCSKRIKKKKMARFKRSGGATPCEIATYVKLEGATTYDEWRKMEEWTEVVKEGLRLLKETLNCSRVAAYFNSVGLPLGKYSRSVDGKWTGRVVRRFFKNRILGGFPGRGHRHTVKHHETGRRVSVVNPAGAIFIERPHLAHVEITELDEVNALLERKNNNRSRKKINGADPRLFVPRKTTVFPSQHARCWYCGFTFIRGANGMVDHIMCSNCRDWHCWNSFGVDCGLAATKIMAAVTESLQVLEGIDAQFRELVTEASRRRVGRSAEQYKNLELSEEKVQREMDNLVQAITEFGPVAELKTKLEELKQQQTLLAAERQRLENFGKRKLKLPSSVADLRSEFERQAAQLAVDSPEFGDLMRQLVPDFHVYLVRLLDGGHPMPRARVTLNMAGCIEDLVLVPEIESLLTRTMTVDLFDPPQRERIREEAVRLDSTKKLTQRDIAKQLSEPTFQVVVQKALAIDRMMKGGGHTSPYQVLLEPPADYTKLRRHLNKQYQFRPMDGYVRPPI